MPKLNVCFCSSLYALKSVLSYTQNLKQTTKQVYSIMFEKKYFQVFSKDLALGPLHFDIFSYNVLFLGMRNATLKVMLMIGNNAEEVLSMKNYFPGFLGVT